MKRALSDIKGIGSRRIKLFRELGINSIEELLEYSPRTYEDRRAERKIKDLSIEDTHIASRVTITGHQTFYSPKKHEQVFKAIAEDDDGNEIEIICFNRPWLQDKLKLDSTWYLYGAVQKSGSRFMTSSFEISEEKEKIGLGRLIPIYPASLSLKSKTISDAISWALENIEIDEVLPSYLIERHHLLLRKEALIKLHRPEGLEDVNAARRTLAYAELLYLDLAALDGKDMKEKERINRPAKIENYFINSLPFPLTDDQAKAISEIRGDLDLKAPMDRLLQGEVGSGKTLVALVAALHEISKGHQVALMAPTEVLARQQADSAERLLSRFGVRVAFLAGDIEKDARDRLLNELKAGNIGLLVGTHALFSKDVNYKSLSLVIIDEEHRFGVEQRKQLAEKGIEPSILTMSATPIPRSLALTEYAARKISTIRMLPSGRKPVKTYTVSDKRREEMYRTIEVEFKRGHQAYFVYPMIDEREDEELAASSMYEKLRRRFPSIPSALLHSRIAEDEKNRILKAFKDGRITYLVSTTVVEVGLDVPSATCMVIERAERFGLASLHQLRGRVGRSSLPSFCFLVSDMESLTIEAKKRLKILKETNDGFLIAEKDLEIRGPGEILGTRQSGVMTLRFADIINDEILLEKAKEDAEEIMSLRRRLSLEEKQMVRAALETWKETHRSG